MKIQYMPEQDIFKDEALQSNLKREFSDFESRLELGIQEFSPILTEWLQSEFPGFQGFPKNVFELSQSGFARLLSLPKNENKYVNPWVTSHKTTQGVLHNNLNDRRTTVGSFHVCEGGMPIAQDKISAPRIVFQNLLKFALAAPSAALEIPYTSDNEVPTQAWATLNLAPLVSPNVPGKMTEKRYHVQFLAPGSCLANLDFVENIFGNAADFYCGANAPGLPDDLHTGVEGMVIVAPWLTTVKKIDLGLPSKVEASAEELEKGYYYESEDELYNNGTAFKMTHRTQEGRIITVIADNYFGYCKKEVKTQISFATNLTGLSEEEHAGGALVYPRWSLGEIFKPSTPYFHPEEFPFDQFAKDNSKRVKLNKKGYARDKILDNVVYLPGDAELAVHTGKITWTFQGEEQEMLLREDRDYIFPWGYQVNLEKFRDSNTWHLVGTSETATFLHKPSTVSGGGKSELSKSVDDVIVQKNYFVANFSKAISEAEKIIDHNYGNRYKALDRNQGSDSRGFLSPERSLGSVIRLLTPSEEYTEEYNDWLNSIPSDIRSLAFTIKRTYNPKWEGSWKDYYSVDRQDGEEGNDLMINRQAQVARFLRIGFDRQGNWNIHRLRGDYMPAEKIQMEDDISVSITVPGDWIGRDADKSYKLIENCEMKLFQRPDEAIHKGQDIQTEIDFQGPNLFAANYEALDSDQCQAEVFQAVEFNKYSDAHKATMLKGAAAKGEYTVSVSEPRIVNKETGARTANVRYLQLRPDIAHATKTALASLRSQLAAGAQEKVSLPVDAVLIGRRNNAPDKAENIKGLSAYNPIHYQELPELMRDSIATLTGKSPSTTGFGTEGALTKNPFNAVWTTADLNQFLVSMALANTPGYSTPCGMIGDHGHVDHDISFWVPELWGRLAPQERDPKFLIEKGLLEKVEDFELNGEKIPASILGYRINKSFVHQFCGRIFANPDRVFAEDILKPELQNLENFAETIQYMADSQKAVAQRYLDDGSVEIACEPLKALLYIMAEGSYKGMNMESPEFRELFTRESILASDWYQKRLNDFAENNSKLGFNAYDLVGTIGLDPIATEQFDTQVESKAKLQEA